MLIDVANEFGQQRGYKSVEFVGKGGFKECFKIVDQHDNEFALKIIDLNNSDLRRIEREMLILATCDSPLINKLYEFGNFVDKSFNSFSFSVEEYLGGGTLEEKLNTGLTKENIVELGTSLIEVLVYIKDKNIVHRDIKPANIMFRYNSTIPVLVDFGIARDLNRTSLTPTWLPSGPCSPYYASPEQLNNEKDLIDWRTDQFSIGIVIGECFYGTHPFKNHKGSNDDAVSNVASRKKCATEFVSLSNSLGVSIILRMLEPWPHRRYQNPQELLNLFKNLR
ncbi:MAG TPA: serine/threonine-protein kinase [Melioribacteraceae bacterium]|nr:serine/threonine-protein kinase [Melioribacteraceae bacterium]